MAGGGAAWVTVALAVAVSVAVSVCVITVTVDGAAVGSPPRAGPHAVRVSPGGDGKCDKPDVLHQSSWPSSSWPLICTCGAVVDPPIVVL